MALVLLALASLAAPAHAQMTPGTIKLLTKAPVLEDSATGDSFVHITQEQSAKFLVVGPETIQVELRVNIAATEKQGPPALFIVLAGGREVARYRVTPRAGSSTWKDRRDFAPGATVGFYATVDAGAQAYEFRVQDAPRGAGLLLVPRSKAKTALAPGTVVIPARPATAAPARTPGPVAVATPSPTPPAQQTPFSLEQIRTTNVRAEDVRRERRKYEASLKIGYAMPAHEEFEATAFVGAEARWAFGMRRLFAVGLEAGQLAFSALVPDDPGRADPPTAVDVQLIPVSLHAVWFLPFEGRLQPYIAGGPGIAYGASVRRQLARPSVEEKVVGFGGQVIAGLQYDLTGSDLREGGNKLLIEARGSQLSVPFEAHDYTNWSSVQVIGGIAVRF